MQNYAGPLTPSKIEELFGLIEYTKTRCDYYAPQVAVPHDGNWSASALAPLATPSRTGWFVPLGKLQVQRWTLDLDVSSAQAVEIEVVNRSGPVAQGELAPEEHSARLTFSVRDSGMPHFLRLRSRGAITFSRATLTEDSGDTDQR